MTIKEFMERTHATAVAKGWWERDERTGALKPRNEAEMLALMHSEIAEALEIHRMPLRKLSDLWMTETAGGGSVSDEELAWLVSGKRPEGTVESKPEGFMVEIADLMIRIADTCEAMKIPLDVVLCNTDVSRLGWGREKLGANVVEALQHMNVCLVYAYNGLQNGRVEDTVAEAFAEIFQTCGQIASELANLSLEYVLVWKMRYNDTRPHRHGNKKC
jgi:hypothetical protein